MKTILAALVLVTIAVLPVENSYGDSIESQLAKNNLYIYAQIEVQNSNGQLVAYLESKKITIFDADDLNLLLDQNAGGIQKNIITISGQKYEMIKGSGSIVHTSPTVVSKSIITGYRGSTVVDLVWADHDGYPVIPGDKVTTTWTIIRPAP